MDDKKQQQISRRDFIRAVGMTGVATAVGSTMTSGWVRAEDAAAPAVNMDQLIASKMAAGPIAMEKVKLDIPAKAENAGLVRLPIEVDHPMEEGNYIQAIAIFVDNNPQPFVAKFHLTPLTGKAAFEVRIKMAKASNIRIIAQNNSGKLFGIVKELQVAEGGCAG